MSISEVNLVLKASDDVIDSIEVGLRKSGVQIAKRELETGEIRFLLPSMYWTLSLLYTILVTYQSQIEGRIELPNGSTFPVSGNGLTEFRNGLLTAMTEDNGINIQYSQQTAVNFWMVYRNEIGEIINHLPKWFEKMSESSARIKNKVIWGIFGLLFTTLLIVGGLTLQNQVSGEALVFLAGTIIGYLFAFLQKYMGITQTAS